MQIIRIQNYNTEMVKQENCFLYLNKIQDVVNKQVESVKKRKILQILKKNTYRSRRVHKDILMVWF